MDSSDPFFLARPDEGQQWATFISPITGPVPFVIHQGSTQMVCASALMYKEEL